MDAFAVSLGAHVGQLFGFARVDGDVVFAGVFANDHAGVDFVARFHHKASAFLDHIQGISHRFAAFHADKRAVLAGGDLASIWPVFVEEMAHHADATGLIDQVGLEADQAAHGNQRLDTDLLAVMVHVGDLAFAAGEILHDRAHSLFGNFQE